jgi:hypothetical protein
MDALGANRLQRVVCSKRSAGCGAAKGRHRDDRAASGQPKQAAHARSAKVKPLHAKLARRTLLRLDSMAAPGPHSLGAPRPQFPRLCPACLPRILFKRF